jgi:hypothetical protein
MDRGSGARRRETPRLPVQDGSGTRWTSGTVVDDGRLTHNPEVAGSNPAPATKARGPFSNREMAFCMWFVHGFVHGACSSGSRLIYGGERAANDQLGECGGHLAVGLQVSLDVLLHGERHVRVPDPLA